MTTRISTASDDGLFALVAGATRALEASNEPIGVIGIELERPSDDSPALLVEATLNPQSHFALARLDVRARMLDEGLAKAELVEKTLERFGGTAYTNLCVERRSEGEAMDLSVSFPSRIPVWAHNLALFGASLAQTEIDGCAAALDALGVQYGKLEQELSVARRQIRKRPTPTEQAAALLAALNKELAATLYVATLPPHHAVRIEQRRVDRGDGELRWLFDVCLSRGMGKGDAITSSSVGDAESYFVQTLGIRFAGSSFTVTNTHGTSKETHRLGPIEKKQIRWSVNWGHRRG